MSPRMWAYMCSQTCMSSCLGCQTCMCAHVCSKTHMCAHMFSKTCRGFFLLLKLWCRTTWTPPGCLTPPLYNTPSFPAWDKLWNHSRWYCATPTFWQEIRYTKVNGWKLSYNTFLCVCSPIQIWSIYECLYVCVYACMWVFLTWAPICAIILMYTGSALVLGKFTSTGWQSNVVDSMQYENVAFMKHLDIKDILK